MTTRSAARRAGFTMVELLVVIVIIGVLAGLLLAGVSKVRESYKRTAAVNDIAQVGNAIAAFKTKMNVGFIPAFGGGPNGEFRLQPLYNSTDPEAVYLKQVFPQLDGCNGPGSGTTGLPTASLDSNQTLLFFLTGGAVTNFQGFSTNRRAPFAVAAGASTIGPFLEVSPSRTRVLIAGGQPHYLDPWGTPYAYFAFDPTVNTYPTRPATPPGSVRNTFPLAVGGINTEDGINIPQGVVQAFVSGGKFLNQKGFQIVSAGPDQTFGSNAPTGAWTAGADSYVSTGPGADDYSNFNQGPLGQSNAP